VKQPLDLPKIKSLILLLDGGDADAVIAAVDAIIRCLQSTGHDLGRSASAAARTHRDFARLIIERHSADLLDPERKFIEVMSRRPRCAERRAEWLESIYCRYF